ncbi:ABC-three component system middle component 2 [Halomonas kalidii]|uniref:Threonine transporter n=1 Tax=Halomonas kalidii TaxID=3043293 RepID=A0ABT6VQB6_9GAMM|nr:ABC-three component system middle component 2 [Halomonas kalidii]MDI5935845.1 threonine transporter [Halomonas kalidii]
MLGKHPFNSTLETGIRALVVLEAFYPRHCDLMEMTWFDHFVVHTGDIDGQDVPGSLHPDLPNRTGELLVRRQLVERSLRMMQQMHLVEVFETETGIEFCASEETPSYVGLLQAPYSLALKERARWMADRFAQQERVKIRELIESRIGRWTTEFTTDDTSSGWSV